MEPSSAARAAEAQALEFVAQPVGIIALVASRRLAGGSCASRTRAPLAALIWPGDRQTLRGRPLPALSLCSAAFRPPVLGEPIPRIVSRSSRPDPRTPPDRARPRPPFSGSPPCAAP
jgi:hypothetical protein